MKKKIIAATALASCIALSATFTGCSLVSTNNKLDMEQVVATVDITSAEKFKEDYSDYTKDVITETSIIKRDLVSYFINVGYSYVQSGYSYEDTFNVLLDALVNNAILIQYSSVALLENKASTDSGAIETYKSFKDDYVKKYEYLLGGEDSDQVNLAKYKLYSSVNSAIDSYEKTIIEEEDEFSGTGTRTTPTNLNTEQDDYYPKNEDGSLNYNIYTGYKGYLIDDSGIYKEDALDGTTRATRIKAYNTFLNYLRNNNLINLKSESEDLTDVFNLEYIQSEYISQLESCLINSYYDLYEEQLQDELQKDNYIQSLYEELLLSQTDNYKSTTAFESAMSSMSSSSFILYSPDTSDSELFDGTNNGKFGFVYNILLPFDAKQSAQLSQLQSILSDDEDDNYYYNERNKLLQNIQTEDQRALWFNGTENYSFIADSDTVYSGGVTGYFGSEDGREYLFFEDNLIDSEEGGRYKKLQAYDGRYSYNGQVYENEDGSYTLIGNKLTIDGMLDEFSAYINYVLTGNKNGNRVNINYTNNYYGNFNNDYYKADGEEDEIDYSKFLYASGKVQLDNFNRSDLFNPLTEQYKAMSAVNELQFAYTTDTGVLSNYIGYSVSAYDTSYIKEFEYAAKKAIVEGAGSFAVCAGDYGWHLIYVTYTFDYNNNGSVYTPDWSKISVEGTFENLFYEWLKSNDLSDISTVRRNKLVNDLNKEDVTVIKYQKRYEDLLKLDIQ